jgi:phosphonate transport system substrate-binding protein
MSASASPVASVITFGAVPFTQDEKSRLLLGDFCTALGDALRVIVKPHRAPSPEALAAAVRAGRVQVAWLSPSLLTTSGLEDLVSPVASSVREGAATYHAALFVRDDSLIRAPPDLAGRRVAYVAKSSAAGYLYPRFALAQRGLDPRTLFGAELFLESHGAVAAAVNEGRADAGATFVVFQGGDPSRPVARAGFTELPGASPCRIVLAAGPIPADVVVACKTFGPRFRTTLVETLQTIAKEPSSRALVVSLFGAQSFAPFSEASLSALHKMLKSARGMGLA